MNINLSPQSETPSVKSATKMSPETEESMVEESSEQDSGGFFAKLAALFKSDTGSEHVEKTVGKALQQTEDSAEKEAVAEKGSDGALKRLEMDAAEIDHAAAAAMSPGGGDEISGLDGNNPAYFALSRADETDVESAEENVGKVMDEGKTVLNRLQQAQRTLMSDGKDLPESVSADTIPDGEAPAGDSEETMSLTKTAGEVSEPADYSQSDAALAEPSDAPVSTTRLNEDKTVTMAELTGGQSPHTATTSSPVATSPHQKSHPVGPGATSDAAEKNKGMTDGAQSIPLMIDGQRIQVSVNAQGEVEVPGKGAMPPKEAAAALASLMGAPDSESMKRAILEQLTAKDSTQGVSLSQQVHQALQPNQHAATTPVTLKENPALAQNDSPLATAMAGASSDAMKNMLAAKAEQLFLKHGKGDVDEKAVERDLLAGLTDSKDSGLAHQLSSLVGQHQGIASPSHLRAESAAASPPIQLTNKENATQELADKVQMMMSKNLKHIDIRLDPPELGRIHIRMHMHGDQASVNFTVANHHARDALEQSMPRLREMLSQQGVQLGESAVQQQASQQQRGYASSGQGQSGSGSARFGDHQEGDGIAGHDVTLNVNVGSKKDGISYYA